MYFTALQVYAGGRDLPSVVDRRRDKHVPGRIERKCSVQVREHSIFPHECLWAIFVNRKTCDFATIVDTMATRGDGDESSGQHQILDAAALIPQKGVNGAVRQFLRADHIAAIVDVAGDIVSDRTWQTAYQHGRPVRSPQYGMRSTGNAWRESGI